MWIVFQYSDWKQAINLGAGVIAEANRLEGLRLGDVLEEGVVLHAQPERRGPTACQGEPLRRGRESGKGTRSERRC
jgi:hypothetical protein